MAKCREAFSSLCFRWGKMDEELQEVKNILHFPEWQQEREWFF